MVKKIIFTVFLVLAMIGASFGAVVSGLADQECCSLVSYNDVNVRHAQSYRYECCLAERPTQIYTTCQLDGDCGCLDCEVSQIGVGFMNIRRSYEDNVIYSNNPRSMFRDDIQLCYR